MLAECSLVLLINALFKFILPKRTPTQSESVPLNVLLYQVQKCFFFKIFIIKQLHRVWGTLIERFSLDREEHDMSRGPEATAASNRVTCISSLALNVFSILYALVKLVPI